MKSTHHLRFSDLLRTAWLGVSSRPQRTVLAALGVALGIASLVALTAASASNQAQLLADLDAKGANLSVLSPVTGPNEQPVPIPETAPKTVLRQDGVERVGVFETAPEDLKVFRNDLVPKSESAGISVVVARPDVLAAVEGRLAQGRWFDNATRKLPTTVLGATAAERLGVKQAGDRVIIGDDRYGVIGVLASAGLASDIDTAAIIGDKWVRSHFAGDTIGDISSIYVRAESGKADTIRDRLPSAAAPGSELIAAFSLAELAEAQTATDDSLSTLGFALGGIALLAGGVGIANTMVVTVMERRGEIGLRRSLGARPGQVAWQFVVEAAVLSFAGGVAGAVLGSFVAVVISLLLQQPVVIPGESVLFGPVAAIFVGCLAGLQPALRASRLAPTAALRAA